MTAKNRQSVYLDTSILVPWIITEDVPEKREKLSKRAQKCFDLLDLKVDGKFNCDFITSDWAIAEMIQAIKERTLFWRLFYDGHEFSSFHRLRKDYPLEESEKENIREYVSDFKIYLATLDINIIKLKLDWREIHELCLRYPIQTPDAVHVVIAKENSRYLVTIDSDFIDAKISEVQVVDPGNLITKKELLLT